MDKRNIVLTGFMGVGKTETGKLLAELLEMDFIDTDAAVEAAMGMKIAEIFRKYGEGRFRSEEASAIEKASLRRGCVIATGGGAVLNPENIRRLRENGIIILLTASVEAIAARLIEAGERPLLRGDGLQKRIGELLSDREPFYMDCDYRIDTAELNAEQAARLIISIIE